MDRRQFLRTLTGAAAGSALPAWAQSQRPNIVFLLSDDQRWDSLGCMGNPIVQTPELDRLAAAGVLFENAFATTAICMASRASIFTGQYKARHGIDDFSLPFTPEAFGQTYPMLLRRAGYRTGFIGKWGIGGELPKDDFDYFEGFSGQGHYFHEIGGEMVHLEELMARQTTVFLEGCSAAQPFCLSVSYKAPHVQDQDPRQYLYDPALEPLYQDVTIPVPETADPKYFEALPEFMKKSEGRTRWEKRFATPERFQESVKGYYRLVTGIDRAVGKLRADLERLGFAPNTVIVYTSDHGILNGEHGLAGKWNMFEESIRNPFIVYDPRLLESEWGQRRDEMVLNIDVAPTLLSFAGVDIPPGMQGRDLTPLLERGAHPAWRTAFYYEHHFARATIIPAVEGVRTKDWKYFRYVDAEPVVEELYDLRADPKETTNLAADPAFAPKLEEMRAQWEAWRRAVPTSPEP